MAKTKKGPAKKAGKKGKTKPMRPAYAKAKTASVTSAPKTDAASLGAKVKWLLEQAAAHGWGSPE